jgi:TIR domain
VFDIGENAMTNDQDFPEFTISYDEKARVARDELPKEVRAELIEIENKLAENPDNYAYCAQQLEDGILIYKPPKPAIDLTCKLDGKVIYVIHVEVRAMPPTALLFISYSHRDKKWLAELRTHLYDLDKQNLIKIWDDGEIKPGDQWQHEIREALLSAKAAVLLVTKNFLASDFINSVELPPLVKAAKSDNVKLLWIAVGTSYVKETIISMFQALNSPEKPLDNFKPPKRDKEYIKIRSLIKAAIGGKRLMKELSPA